MDHLDVFFSSPNPQCASTTTAFTMALMHLSQGYRVTVPGRIGQTLHEVATMHGVSVPPPLLGQCLPLHELQTAS